MKKLVLAIAIAVAIASVSYADRDADFREAVRLATASTNSLLASGKIFVGNAQGVAAPVALTGPVGINNAGLTTINLAVPGAIGGTTPAAGTFTTMKANAIMSAPVALTAVTNGQAITLSGSVVTVAASEAATVTLANPSLVGQIVVIANVDTETVTIARAANVALGAATRAITENGTLTLMGAASNLWLEVANSIGNAVE
jgi:hypothetical protein